MSLKTVIGAAFKHLRKEWLSKVEVTYYISIDRKWMNKDQVILLLQRAEEEGLIRSRDGGYIPTFDPGAVDVPLGYKPPVDILLRPDPIKALVKEIAEEAGVDQRSIYAEMNTLLQDHFNGRLWPEAAVLILARRYRVPSGRYQSELKAQVMKRAEKDAG